MCQTLCQVLGSKWAYQMCGDQKENAVKSAKVSGGKNGVLGKGV